MNLFPTSVGLSVSCPLIFPFKHCSFLAADSSTKLFLEFSPIAEIDMEKTVQEIYAKLFM